MNIFIPLLIGAFIWWYAWHAPNAIMKRLTAKARFLVTLVCAVLMAGLFLFADPQNPEVTAPLMGAVFALAVLLGYRDVRRAARSA